MTVNQLNIAICIAVGTFGLNNVNAALSVKLDKPKTTGNKTVVKLTLKNTFTEQIEGARATLFLIGDKDKIVGQRTAWVIGGQTEKTSLAVGATATYNFVLTTDKPIVSNKVIFSKLVLEGGKEVDPKTAVILEE